MKAWLYTSLQLIFFGLWFYIPVNSYGHVEMVN